MWTIEQVYASGPKVFRESRKARMGDRVSRLSRAANRVGLAIGSRNRGHHVILYSTTMKPLLHFWPSTYRAVLGKETTGPAFAMDLDGFCEFVVEEIARVERANHLLRQAA